MKLNKTIIKLYKNFTILNIVSVSFVILILYFFFVNLNLNSFLSKTNLLGCLISFVVSGLISSFVLNNFKFSRYILVRIIEKLVIYSICFIICIYISSYFGLNIINEILCAGDDNVKEAKDLVKVQSVDNNNKTTY